MTRRARPDLVLTNTGSVTSCNIHKTLTWGVPICVFEGLLEHMEFSSTLKCSLQTACFLSFLFHLWHFYQYVVMTTNFYKWEVPGYLILVLDWDWCWLYWYWCLLCPKLHWVKWPSIPFPKTVGPMQPHLVSGDLCICIPIETPPLLAP